MTEEKKLVPRFHWLHRYSKWDTQHFLTGPGSQFKECAVCGKIKKRYV